jgi:hypothetical protein
MQCRISSRKFVSPRTNVYGINDTSKRMIYDESQGVHFESRPLYALLEFTLLLSYMGILLDGINHLFEILKYNELSYSSKVPIEIIK